MSMPHYYPIEHIVTFHIYSYIGNNDIYSGNTTLLYLQLVYVRYTVSTLDTCKKLTKLNKLLSTTLKADSEWTFLFCLELLHSLTSPDCMLTVVQFIMSEMMEDLDSEQKESVELCYTGIKVEEIY